MDIKKIFKCILNPNHKRVINHKALAMLQLGFAYFPHLLFRQLCLMCNE